MQQHKSKAGRQTKITTHEQVDRRRRRVSFRNQT